MPAKKRRYAMRWEIATSTKGKDDFLVLQWIDKQIEPGFLARVIIFIS